jgi:hypothetical protein
MSVTTGSCFVITGSLTLAGSVAYLDANGEWAETIANAMTFPDSTAAEGRLDEVRKAESVITEPYIFPAEMDGAQLIPISAREKLRAEGPSTRLRRPDGAGAL